MGLLQQSGGAARQRTLSALTPTKQEAPLERRQIRLFQERYFDGDELLKRLDGLDHLPRFKHLGQVAERQLLHHTHSWNHVARRDP